MPTIETIVSCPVHRSFGVEQVAGMFDVPLADRSRERYTVEIPGDDERWQIGLVVGPSGSGKSTVARAAWGDRVASPTAWADDRAAIDGFGAAPLREVTSLLTAVGFGSPPSWIKPYSILSQGERFRCDLARALLNVECGARIAELGEESTSSFSAFPLVVFDEFTSTIDRRAAKIASAAIAKAIRDGKILRRFVAVTCHYDVAEWIEPDWVLDMADGRLQRRRLRRRPIRLEIFAARRSAWRRFARHHYLSGSLSARARCFVVQWEREPVAFCATLPSIGRRGHWRFTRIVTLPDFQGVGIGTRAAEAVAELHRAEGKRINVTTSHPAMIAHCRRSPRWRTVGVKRNGSGGASHFIGNYRASVGRGVASFEFVQF